MSSSVIDAHGHVLEPKDLWENYLESKYKDRAIRFEKTKEGVDYLVFDGKPSPYSFGVGPFGAGTGRDYEELSKPGGFGYFDGPRGAYEPHARLRWLDERGIQATMILPSLGLIWGSTVSDVELNAAYTRAYNNWAVEFCATAPKRLLPSALVPIWDINEGVREIRRVAKLGVKAVLVFATPLTREGFWDRAYDRVWATLCEANLPVILHPALNPSFFGHQWVSSDQGGIIDDRYLLYMESCAVVLDVQAALAQLFQGAVFDRFPRLKVVMLETGAGWITHAFERMDQKYARVGKHSPLKHAPRDYFQRQCWIGVDPEETSLPGLVERFGNRFVWGSDMPHWDAFPDVMDMIHTAAAPLSEDARREVLGGSAARLFEI